MLYLKAETIDGKTEYFNTQHILNITEHQNGNYKILIGAGMYWNVKGDTIKFVQLENIFK